MRQKTLTAFGLLVLALAIAASAAIGAFQVPQDFQPVKPGDRAQEVLPATPLVFAAYAFVWSALLAYVFLLWRRIGRVERELADLVAGRRLDKR